MGRNENGDFVISKGAMKFWSLILSIVMLSFTIFSYFVGKWAAPLKNLAVLEERVVQNSKVLDRLDEKIEEIKVVVYQNKADVTYLKEYIRNNGGIRR